MQILLQLAAFFLGSGAGAYLGAYLRKKGEGLATQEDIGKITKAVEDAKKEYAADLAKLTEAMRAQTSLRMLAGEKRIDAHQKAYMKWGDMVNYIHGPSEDVRQSILSDCRKFYFENCLYLDEKVKESFLAAMQSFDVHRELLRGQELGDIGSRARLVPAITENFQRVRALGDDITQACKLPSIAGDPETFKRERST